MSGQAESGRMTWRGLVEGCTGAMANLEESLVPQSNSERVVVGSRVVRVRAM